MWNIYYLIALNDLLSSSKSADIKILQPSSEDMERFSIFIELDGENLQYEIERKKSEVAMGLQLNSSYIERFQLSEELLHNFKCRLLPADETDEATAVKMAILEYVFDECEAIEVVSQDETRDYLVAEYRLRDALSTRVTVLERREHQLCYEVLTAAKCVRSGYQLSESKGSGIVVVHTPRGSEFSFNVPARKCDCRTFSQQGNCAHSQFVMQYIRNRSLYSICKERTTNGINSRNYSR